jgi:hypothetical protein
MKTTNYPTYPTTVREAGERAAQEGLLLSEYLERRGPFPMPPSGYSLAQGSSSRWIGHETVRRGWIITPVWNAATGALSLELWMAEHRAPNYTNLSPSEALELAADLTATARALEAARDGE